MNVSMYRMLCHCLFYPNAILVENMFEMCIYSLWFDITTDILTIFVWIVYIDYVYISVVEIDYCIFFQFDVIVYCTICNIIDVS